MDNLFTSTEFCIVANIANTKVLTLGVIRVYSREIPPFVYKIEEKKSIKKERSSRNSKGYGAK